LCWHSPVQGETYRIDAISGAITTHHDSISTPSLFEKQAENNIVKIWSVRLLSYDNRTAAETLVNRLGDKGFPSQIIATSNGRYLVQISDLKSAGQAMAYRRSLLRETSILPNHIHIASETHRIKKDTKPQKKTVARAAVTVKPSPVKTPPIFPTPALPLGEAKSHEPEPVILHVTLNTEDAGTHFLTKTSDDDLQVTKALLKKFGLKHLPIDQARRSKSFIVSKIIIQKQRIVLNNISRRRLVKVQALLVHWQ